MAIGRFDNLECTCCMYRAVSMTAAELILGYYQRILPCYAFIIEFEQYADPVIGPLPLVRNFVIKTNMLN